MKKLVFYLSVCVLTGTLSACGGGGSAATSSTPASATVTGVATPSAVSVVTAN
jgi:hypothetical protein